MDKVYVGSNNIVKINATKKVLEPYGYQVLAYSADSQVSNQPLSDEETIQGAINRASLLPKDGLRIGLEAGVQIIGDDLYLTNYGVLIDQNGLLYKAGGTRIILPNMIKTLIMEEHLELSEAMEKAFSKVDIKHQEGAIGYFTNNLVVREDIFIHLVKLLYGQYLFKTNQGGLKCED